MAKRTCELDGCDDPYLAKGLCSKHYQRKFKSKKKDVGEAGPIPERTCHCGKTYMPYRDYQRACSKKCREQLPDRVAAQREYDARVERRRAQNIARMQRRAQRQPGHSPYERWDVLRRKYGVTQEWFEEKLAVQDGKCAICRRPPDPNGTRAAASLHVDHDHATGAVRDLLCCRCNQGIGYFEHNLELFDIAKAYISRHRQAIAQLITDEINADPAEVERLRKARREARDRR